jgi:hypothetical protein
VRWILSQPAGSSPDATARLISERLARQWGQGVVVDNRPGGQNVIGAQLAARARPDGYTYFYATTAALVINPLTFKTLPYDPRKDFVPVGMIGMSPFLVVCGPAAGAESRRADRAGKANPELKRHQGPRTFSGLLGAMFGALPGSGLPFPGYCGDLDTIAGRTRSPSGARGGGCRRERALRAPRPAAQALRAGRRADHCRTLRGFECRRRIARSSHRRAPANRYGASIATSTPR